jgi:hypothetical protein
MAKNPMTCMMRIAPSIAGRKLLTAVLNSSASIMQAYMMSNAFQSLGLYEVLLRWVRDCIIDPARMKEDVRAPCQPHTVSQPCRTSVSHRVETT